MNRDKIDALYHADEAECLRGLTAEAGFPARTKAEIAKVAANLVSGVRDGRRPSGGVDVFLQEYGLSTEEGVTLMCLAESLLRIPDDDTAERLIRDKIGGADWAKHLGSSDSYFVNASTWALMLTGHVVTIDQDTDDAVDGFLRGLVRKSGEPIIREALRHAMKIIGRQFVSGRTIEEALAQSQDDIEKGYLHSFDMLGEGARTATDADRYLSAYQSAIYALAERTEGKDISRSPSVSVKLSALHPRYEYRQRDRVISELVPRLLDLCLAAREAKIGLCIDAEEADRLDLSLDVIASVAGLPLLAGWDGLGLAVQAYQKRAYAVIDWLGELAVETDRRLMVRLVKGAYWDSEIKNAQEGGYADYPVFTRKEATDVSYLACARKLLAAPMLFYPQFATHNAHTVAAVRSMVAPGQDFEFQRLHGMGAALYDQLVGNDGPLCRIYAPVGGHESLLAYLVRRLLENGANTSFVNRITDDSLPVERVIEDPADKLGSREPLRNPQIPLPADLYGEARRNAEGDDLSDGRVVHRLYREMAAAEEGGWLAGPIIGGQMAHTSAGIRLPNPADRHQIVGTVHPADDDDVEAALAMAQNAASDWNGTPVEQRAVALNRTAELLESNRAELYALCLREAGKTLDDAVSEVREAVDFCRYYAWRALEDFGNPSILPGPTGEKNTLSLHGRGVFACISPWNFPLAIFTGQVAAALAAGNAVVAKPAEQTPLIAALAVALMLDAGVPPSVLHLLPGDGAGVGARLVADERISGVAFTGSFETAQRINRSLSARSGPIVPLIAETGGQNALIADSSALLEQVVDDAIRSAFQSAGQRCSALRCLYVQEDIADDLIEMLIGRAREVVIGNPWDFSTDVGPVIDTDALGRLHNHVQDLRGNGELLFEAVLPGTIENGNFFAPRIYGIEGIEQLKTEVFGPVLHIVRYPSGDLDKVVEAINGTGYGLTVGIHSRVDETVARVQSGLRVGNTYVNRNMIGAVVGVQPFGGEGLSGTGPKAGGPHYLSRFAIERTISVNTTASGGNTELLSLGDGSGGESPSDLQ